MNDDQIQRAIEFITQNQAESAVRQAIIEENFREIQAEHKRLQAGQDRLESNQEKLQINMNQFLSTQDRNTENQKILLTGLNK